MTKLAKAIEPEGHNHRTAKLTEDDVEGHRSQGRRAVEPEGFRSTGKITEDDTEGHSMANALIGREISRAREIEIQRNLKAHSARDEASRPHKK